MYGDCRERQGCDSRRFSSPAVQQALVNPDRLLELSFFYEDPRTRVHARANSVLLDAKRLWLRSDEGLAWHDTREGIFGRGTSSRDMPADLPIEDTRPAALSDLDAVDSE